MQKIINYLKCWAQHIATHPTTVKAIHTFWQSFLGSFLVGIFAVHSAAALYALVIAAVASGLSALKSYLVSLKQTVSIPGEEN